MDVLVIFAEDLIYKFCGWRDCGFCFRVFLVGVISVCRAIELNSWFARCFWVGALWLYLGYLSLGLWSSFCGCWMEFRYYGDFWELVVRGCLLIFEVL